MNHHSYTHKRKESDMTPEKLRQMLERAFQEGFAVSREGFNGECKFDHLGPDGLTLEKLCELTVDGILQDD